MKEKDAREILHALVQGNHPATGEPLTGHPVLQEATVLRALLAGADALRLVSERKERMALRPAKVGQRWTAEEDAVLAEAFKRGDSIEQIAKVHNRSTAGIELRLEKLGLVAPGERRTQLPARNPQS